MCWKHGLLILFNNSLLHYIYFLNEHINMYNINKCNKVCVVVNICIIQCKPNLFRMSEFKIYIKDSSQQSY